VVWLVYAIVGVKITKNNLLQQEIRTLLKSRPYVTLPVYLSIMAIFRNEADYLQEWIEYHLLVGVERFWLINNKSEDNATAILYPYVTANLVCLYNVTGRHKQVVAYNSIIHIIRKETFWVAAIDIDEFLVPMESHCIPPILRRFQKEPALDVNWIVYGWNRKESKGIGLVIERFPYHSNWTARRNHFVKIIMRPPEVLFLHVHWGRYKSGRSANFCGFNKMVSIYSRPPCHRVLRINHYWSKSKEEWERKVLRGHGFNKGTYSLSGYTSIDDVVKNDTTMNWYLPRVKANLEIRNTYSPCHIVTNPSYYDDVRAAYESQNATENFAWVTLLRSYFQSEKDLTLTKR
jgi:hypothetical protein